MPETGTRRAGAQRPDSRNYNCRYIDALKSDAAASRMLGHVRRLLAPVDSVSKSGRSLPFRSRYAHTERVTEWALRLAEKEKGDIGVIAVAAIFHDSGYSRSGEGHAAYSAQIFDEYMRQGGATPLCGMQASPSCDAPAEAACIARAAPDGAASCGAVAAALGVPACVTQAAQGHTAQGDAAQGHTAQGREAPAGRGGARLSVPIGARARHIINLPSAVLSALSSAASVGKIRMAIASHSDKDDYGDGVLPETKVLSDADMLDEAGAMAVLWDCFSEASLPEYDFAGAYLRILARYESDAQAAGRFRTAEGRRRYMEMRRYVGEFVGGLKTEVNL